MRTVHFYDLESGIFTGVEFSFFGREEVLTANTPPGCGVYEGETDYLSQRVDVESKHLVDYQPPAPGDDHEWIHDDEQGNRVRRWALKPEAAERIARRAAAIDRIAQLERKQERALREHALGIVPTDDDRAAGALTLQEIQDEIAEQRAIINSADSNAT